MRSLSSLYSGIVINQNQPPVANNDYISSSNAQIYQEFFLPSDYTRGTEGEEQIIPDLSGFQLFVRVRSGRERATGIIWTIEHYQIGTGWVELTSGVSIGAHSDGEQVWIDCLLENPLPISEELLDNRFRIGLTNLPNNSSAIFDQPVTYEGGRATLQNGTQIDVQLISGQPYYTTASGGPGFLYLNATDDSVYYSDLQSPLGFWYTYPNPLALEANAARQANGTTTFTDSGNDVSLLFRVLGLVADEGIDFLGNRYRSVVATSAVGNVNTNDIDTEDAFWMSKPNPSRFAVESLYFDLRQYAATTYTGGIPDPPSLKNEPVVIDRILIDPITPGVYFNVYFSNEGEGATNEGDWENKLWTKVPGTFYATKKDTHVLPYPVVARYVKLEFSHLQARSYNPGDLSRPTTYKKHPKWVLDYFMARLESHRQDENKLLFGNVGVVYDAFSFAYKYYLDDIGLDADAPYELSNSTSVVEFLGDRTDLSDQMDPAMSNKINTALSPYRASIANWAKNDYLLGNHVLTRITQSALPIEVPVDGAVLNADEMNTLRNTDIVFEQEFPVMFFYLTCRHKYREIIAEFSHNRAYFVGLREIAFTRDRYTSAFDTNQYIEPAGDTYNVERNDFVNENGTMTVY